MFSDYSHYSFVQSSHFFGHIPSKTMPVECRISMHLDTAWDHILLHIMQPSDRWTRQWRLYWLCTRNANLSQYLLWVIKGAVYSNLTTSPMASLVLDQINRSINHLALGSELVWIVFTLQTNYSRDHFFKELKQILPMWIPIQPDLILLFLGSKNDISVRVLTKQNDHCYCVVMCFHEDFNRKQSTSKV